MANRKLDIAFWNYDRVGALTDGTVQITGVDPQFHSARIVTDIFEGMIRQRAYDVSELGFTYFLRAMEAGDGPFLALPVFPNRAFRHSSIYINKRAGITRPQELNGKRIGELALYSHDAGLMAKGMLADEYGFRPETCRWIVGGIDFPMSPVDFVARPHPADITVEIAGKETDLGDLLDRGEIDALISADIPQCVLEGSPNVGRLFDDYVSVERDYYRRTGIFPIMHIVVVTRALAAEEPNLVKAVYDGLCKAKDAMAAQLVRGLTFNSMAMMVPWLPALIQANREVLGQNWWPYGMKANAAAIDAVLRYHHEQGITTHRFTSEEIFVPYLLET